MTDKDLDLKDFDLKKVETGTCELSDVDLERVAGGKEPSVAVFSGGRRRAAAVNVRVR